MLLGEYYLSLDDKGRLSIPATLRRTLREIYAPHETTLVVTRFFENCLVVYPQPEWVVIQQRLLELPNEPSLRAFTRQLCASANPCTLDRQGRLLVPPKLRRYAEIETDVVVLGVMRKLEVWSPRRWEAYEAQERGRFDSNPHLMDLPL